MNRKKFRIYLNAPITMAFVAICLIALGLDYLSNGRTNMLIFSTYGASWLDPLTYVRLVCHIFGHANLNHLTSNMLYILLLGPMLEEKYHDRLITIILVTALTTGIIHNFLEPNVMLMGASGVAFAFILLASITGREEGIPLTLILVACLWLGQEVVSAASADNISQITHIIGGICGAFMGLYYKKR